MIRAEVDENGVAVVLDLPPGSVAYIDRDWLRASAQPVPSIVVQRDGGLTWCSGPPIEVGSRSDPDTAAALVLLAVAQEAAAAVKDLPPESVEVNGTGLIARRLRALVGKRAAELSERSSQREPPGAIVETTGDSDAILDATRRVADLGMVVLAGESLGQTVEMNLYPDVHVRGLTIVGIAPPAQPDEAVFAETAADDSVLESCRRMLVRARSGAFLPRDAAWYAVASGSEIQRQPQGPSRPRDG
jgi:hypothetical protein